MANFIVTAAWNAIKPTIRTWLKTRALVLPASDRAKFGAEIAKLVKCDAATAVLIVDQAQSTFANAAVTALDTFRP